MGLQAKTLLMAVSILMTSTLLSSKAQAYDEDAHFYGTYAMARHTGIRHEVAMKIALSAQWMDESFISDPTSMIFLPVTGIKKRRLLHFPSSRVSGAGSSSAQRQIFGMNDLGEFTTSILKKLQSWSLYTGDIENVNFFTETSEDHPFASQMLMEGLKEGNLMKASAGLHTLEDSFAHAGTPAEQGHALFWHWPDRPFASVDKYKRMVKSVTLALVAIRTMLPPEALDCSLNTAGPIPNCKTDAITLANSYIPLIQPVMAHDMLRDSVYVKAALHEFWERATSAGYTKLSKSEFDARVARLQLVDTKTSAYEALQQLLVQFVEEASTTNASVLDFGKILRDMGKIQSSGALSLKDYIASYGIDDVKEMDDGALETFAHVISSELLAWHVPEELSDTHRMEIEDDTDEVRQVEMKIREHNMRKFIYKQFGVNIIFVKNNTLSEVGFYKEMIMDPSAEPDFTSKPDFKKEPGAVYATFNLKEKNQFDNIIISYLFPTMTKQEVQTLMTSLAKIKILLKDRSNYYAERKVIEANPQFSWMMRKWQLLNLDWKYSRYKDISAGIPKAVSIVLDNIRPMAQKYVNDLVTTHISPSDDNFVYRRSKLLNEYAASGKVIPLLGKNDAWTSQSLFQPAK